MLDITSEHISALSDEDLRTLVGLLSEAELRKKGISVSFVKWGGRQTARDGGLDVDVAILSASIDGFIPRPATGFQVKKSDIKPKGVAKEMCPEGTLRQAIRDLVESSGAYIIASGAARTTSPAIDARREAMRAAVRDVPDSDRLFVDFYDAGRLASWVRDHQGLIPWVRSAIGQAIPGWRSYGRWSRSGHRTPHYFADETARIRKMPRGAMDALSATRGIEQIRASLSTPGAVVRLVGLSGLGKTRLAEALFDDSVGENALDPATAVYADCADQPTPAPQELVRQAIARGSSLTFVVDNCSPEVHRQLSDAVRSPGTTVSAMSIEYDIREDQPEGTDVFILEPSSDKVVEQLVGERFPTISHVDRQRIAEFSGGNARIALALAEAVLRHGPIASLSDDLLLRRLVEQRKGNDELLLSVARVCSLVYSFDGELEGNDSELTILGSLGEVSSPRMYKAVAELMDRDLVQQRGKWRAVLPHAVANRLASWALTLLPPAHLLSILENAPQRLLRSFTRRLSYLDPTPESQAIVRRWLEPGGLFSDVLALDKDGRDMFANVASVLPAEALTLAG